MSPVDVVVTAASVLHRAAGGLTGFADWLRAGHIDPTRTPIGDDEVPASLLTGFSVAQWAAEHLSDRREMAGRLCRVAARAALPARTAACVAAAAAAAGRLPPGEGLTVLVAGNNLALGYQHDATVARLREPDRVRASHIRDCFDTDALGAVGEVIGAGEEGFVVGGASASGNLAVIQGIRLIQAGVTPRCLVVAPVQELSPLEVRSFVLSGAMTTHACRPFDRTHTGFAYGQAAAAVLLEPAATARRRTAPVLARLLGHGLRLDALRGTAPRQDGQVAAMLTALKTAGAVPSDIDYVSTHGTGSVLGDEVETASLHAVFGPGTRPRINATKGLTGHAMAAAGLVELVAAILQMRDGYCHANPWLTDPIRKDLGFVGAQPESLQAHLALNNSFGTSGISSSVLLGAGEER